ncbi:MAG: ATP-binding cassette domain-containing protein, partial [Bryobacteraceae bacterium]
DMTHDLVERMTGHRTRLSQEPPEQWHEGEDQALERYLVVSKSMDRYAALLSAFIPRGWLVVGAAGLIPWFVAAQGSGAGIDPRLAVAVGGMLLAHRALVKLVNGVWNLVGAGISWKQVAPLFHAAARPEERGQTAGFAPPSGQAIVVEARDLTFRYRDRGEPVLRGANLRIAPDDFLLLQGPSGGGKSTLAALLSGLRDPSSGMLLARGLDRQTLGARAWRRRIAAAPQFHENHVLAGSFAFNLLMGRRWPPTLEDLQEAEAVCRDLGLGPLLQRMPGGVQQMVGETGWQLSQGEKSRLYIARALLSGGDLVVLDESFGALDPETLRQSLECVLKRARTLLVVAHP